MKSHFVKTVVGSLSVALLLAASAVLYANCGACGTDKKAGAETHSHAGQQCVGCTEAKQGQLCVHCTVHKLDLSGEEAKALETALKAYNKKIETAQSELLASTKKSLGEANTKKLAASFKKAPKKDPPKK